MKDAQVIYFSVIMDVSVDFNLIFRCSSTPDFFLISIFHTNKKFKKKPSNKVNFFSNSAISSSYFDVM